MDIDELDALLLDDYDPFSKDTNDTNDPKAKDNETTFDPLAATNGKRSSDDAPSAKKRQKFKRLNADVLLSDKGLPRLRHEAPWLKFQGKGHEDADLRKLIDYYTIWAHSLYPRLQFRDFSRKVLNATQEARVKYTLNQWQDEYYEKQSVLNENNPDKTTTAEDDDNDDDDDDDEDEDRPTEETNVPVERNNNSESDDSDEDNDLFLDYLTGVRTDVNDTPLFSTSTNVTVNKNLEEESTHETTATSTQQQSNNPMIRSIDNSIQEDPKEQHSNIQLDKKDNQDEEEDDDEPLFLNITNNRKAKRIIQDDDSDMSE
ncbi:replication fork protection component Swi3-domain-containing protein [Phascolomyces articulosus]|uniref:Chromosome segregation in meiosis protein n=1 Tax=Phascolomyces articulosus TaxID=60185 RepID=A0AAD5L055_9FUNG|nr:replication fork protection component Swi3-domain-containing protein [Phascolomyces articulosus]